ncbi:hypothetical protein TH24_18940 [Thalassospira xiamenensis]|nr:hypothetical protein TH24_18940 [Thalassospira xiamenensis]
MWFPAALRQIGMGWKWAKSNRFPGDFYLLPMKAHRWPHARPCKSIRRPFLISMGFDGMTERHFTQHGDDPVWGPIPASGIGI